MTDGVAQTLCDGVYINLKSDIIQEELDTINSILRSDESVQYMSFKEKEVYVSSRINLRKLK